MPLHLLVDLSFKLHLHTDLLCRLLSHLFAPTLLFELLKNALLFFAPQSKLSFLLKAQLFLMASFILTALFLYLLEHLPLLFQSLLALQLGLKSFLLSNSCQLEFALSFLFQLLQTDSFDFGSFTFHSQGELCSSFFFSIESLLLFFGQLSLNLFVFSSLFFDAFTFFFKLFLAPSFSLLPLELPLTGLLGFQPLLFQKLLSHLAFSLCTLLDQHSLSFNFEQPFFLLNTEFLRFSKGLFSSGSFFCVQSHSVFLFFSQPSTKKFTVDLLLFLDSSSEFILFFELLAAG